jgi:DNA-binding transcriptional ArsR family regulator
VNRKNTHTAFGQFPTHAVEVIAARLAVIAEPTRIRLLELLNDDDETAGEISERLRLSPEVVAEHLDALHAAGFVSRQGSPARYHLIDWTDWWVVEQVARNLADQHRPGRAEGGGGR